MRARSTPWRPSFARNSSGVSTEALPQMGVTGADIGVDGGHPGKEAQLALQQGRPPRSTGRAFEPQKLEVSAVAIPAVDRRINAIIFARMAQLIVRKLEPEVVARLKERAGRKGRSAEEEHRAILREALLGTEAESSEMSFEQYLEAMHDAGDDEDFARIEGGIREIDLSV